MKFRPRLEAISFRLLPTSELWPGPATVDKWDRKLWKAIDDLTEFPGSGAPRPALGEHVRIAIVHPYILLYEHVRGSDLIEILRVVHGRRRITRDLLGT